MIGAISIIGTRWLHHIQISETTVQELMSLIIVTTVYDTERGMCSYELYYFYESGQSGFIQRK